MAGLNIIDYFGLRWKYSELYPMKPVLPSVQTNTLISQMKAEKKVADSKERYRKQVRSLKGKIKRARLRMVEATDEKTFEKYRKKLWDCEKHLALVQGKSPFEDREDMETFNDSAIGRWERVD